MGSVETTTSVVDRDQLVGVSLLAMAVGQATLMATDWALSRAGSLLQGLCVG
jgi:hypothetical protein